MVCNIEFKRITKMHLDKHSMSLAEYKVLYPGSPLICEETLKRYSDGTKRHYSSLSDEQKKVKYANRHYSEDSMKIVLANLDKGRGMIDYTSKERNQAISVAKKKWWSEKSFEERGGFIKTERKTHSSL